MTDKVLVPVEPPTQKLVAAFGDWCGHNRWIEASTLIIMWRRFVDLGEAAPTDELAELERDCAQDWAMGVLIADSVMEGEWRRMYGAATLQPNWIHATRYLELRGLLERHPTNAEWVRIRESDDG